ncbi:MAG: DUF1684 domain-containing protein [Acidobacteria bacterium]|nr:DUF1684 domain-containing protein [Acidobacteriota bacterium]MXZ70601.1 DUF1684 domain-containing protein [Acidobacteriota bacterium]MYD71742.1 DUF1684 domain-containing protein [Acidobacteriota bacterium]MYJ05883.1 DUF1684 domain-containing protein [Acidobacteriota bacterium]
MVATKSATGPGARRRARHRSAGRSLALTMLVSAAVAAACGPPPPDEADYVPRLLEDRALKDEFFRSAPDSPVPLDRRSWMLPLRYYEPNPAYRVPANLVLSDDPQVFDVPTSTGLMRKMEHVGHLEFVLQGERYRLDALVSDGDPGLFIPFRDETSRTETYAAGRYLDLPFSPTGVYDLDFNRAYTPTCYFDEQFDCPFPPPQNRLPIPIRAGERLPPEDERRLP